MAQRDVHPRDLRWHRTCVPIRVALLGDPDLRLKRRNARWFPKVSLQRYKDGLVITEAEPLVAYVVSTAAKSNFVGERLSEFTRFLEQEISAHGAIYVTKDSGLFEAWRSGRAWFCEGGYDTGVAFYV
jgi:hypothetical protein